MGINTLHGLVLKIELIHKRQTLFRSAFLLFVKLNGLYRLVYFA